LRSSSQNIYYIRIEARRLSSVNNTTPFLNQPANQKQAASLVVTLSHIVTVEGIEDGALMVVSLPT
jgi:hypothetical protein